MVNKDIILQRIFDNGESTIGYLVYDDKLMYTLEDTFRVNKIKDTTRIPEGRYKLSLRVTMSPKTKDYRAKYDWFKWHIELERVNNFENVYLHIGNKAEDSAGCILCGTTPTNNDNGANFIHQSTIAFKRFYAWIFPKLRREEVIYIQVRNEIHREDIIKEQIRMGVL